MAASAGQQHKAHLLETCGGDYGLLAEGRLCPPGLCYHDTGLHGARHTAFPSLRRSNRKRQDPSACPSVSISPCEVPEPPRRENKEERQVPPQRGNRVAERGLRVTKVEEEIYRKWHRVGTGRTLGRQAGGERQVVRKENTL